MKKVKLHLYRLGTWVESEFEQLSLIPCNDLQQFLIENKFNTYPEIEYGSQYESNISIFANLNNNNWLVFLTYLSGFCLVYIDHIPSLLLFIKEYKNLFIKDSIFIEDEEGDLVNKNYILRIHKSRDINKDCKLTTLKASYALSENEYCETNLIYKGDSEDLHDYYRNSLGIYI